MFGLCNAPKLAPQPTCTGCNANGRVMVHCGQQRACEAVSWTRTAFRALKLLTLVSVAAVRSLAGPTERCEPVMPSRPTQNKSPPQSSVLYHQSFLWVVSAKPEKRASCQPALGFEAHRRIARASSSSSDK